MQRSSLECGLCVILRTLHEELQLLSLSSDPTKDKFLKLLQLRLDLRADKHNPFSIYIIRDTLPSSTRLNQ